MKAIRPKMMVLAALGILALIVACGIGTSSVAYALPCYQGSVSGSTACEDGINNNDLVSIPPHTVNTETFHGFSDWVYLSKYNAPDPTATPPDPGGLEEPVDVDWTVLPDSGSWSDDDGTWSFNSTVWSTYSDVMIVVKSGKHKPNLLGPDRDVFFSGYLLDNGAMPESGTWATGEKNLSHLSLYARGGTTTPVPEPSTMLLLGTGLAGLAGLKRRRSHS